MKAFLNLSLAYLLLLFHSILLKVECLDDQSLVVDDIGNNRNDDNDQSVECPLSYSIEFQSTNSFMTNLNNVTYLNPKADVFFTVFLPEFQCQKLQLNRPETGNKQRDSLIYLNAIKYALNILNDRNSNIEKEANGSAVSSSSSSSSSVLNLFPLFSNLNSIQSSKTRVTYGAKIFFIKNDDNNGPKEHHHVEHLKCVLTKEPNIGEETSPSHETVKDLALIDGAQVFDANNKEALDRHIPIIPLTTSESILTAPFRASLIINLLDILEWKHFSIITSRNEDSLYIVKILGQLTHTEQICISDILEMPPTLPPEATEDDRKALLQQFQQKLHSFIQAIFHPAKRIPVLIISNDQNELLMITEMLNKNYEKQLQNHQFFFTIIPSPELLDHLKHLSQNSKVITLTSKLPDVPLLNETKNCFTMADYHFNNDIWKNWLSFSPIRYIIFMSIALNLARNDICQNGNINQTFWCDDLVRFERKLFFNYLSDLEDKVEMPLMTLSSIDSEGHFQDLLIYNGNEFKFVNSEFLLDSSNCINNDCNSCIKFRQSRTQNDVETDDETNNGNVGAVPMKTSASHDDHDEQPSPPLLLNEKENISNEDEMMVPNEDVSMLHVETYEITLGLLLPLHKSGSSILDCSTELNLPAYYIYEASKWIVEKINQNNYLIPGIEIKLELIDTCSSPFYATQELAHLTSSDAKVQPIAFVSSLPRDHYKQIVEFVSSINYTLIATQDISFMDFNFGPKYGILQTATTSQNLIKALFEQLKYFGWRYISVVVDPDDLVSSTMFHHFQEMAIQEKICFVSIEHTSNSNNTLAKLVDNYKNGASVVVMLINYASTVNLMTFYRSYTKFDQTFNGNLLFMVIRDQNLESVYGFEEEYLGSIFIRESIGNINHFDNHFLDLVSNPRKDKILYSFIQQCGVNSAQCLRTISSFDKTITTNTMQAILSIVGGFARMRNQTCANEKGICNEMLYSDFHRNLLKFILNTRSMRIDSETDKKFKSENYDIFEFTSDGTSARDIEVLNFKHDHSNGLFRFDNVALYNPNHQSLVKNPNIRYIFYKFNGLVSGHKEYNETEFINSDCINVKKCSQCEPQSPEFIYMPSWDNLIVSGIFDVHSHSAQNPFICERNETIYDNIQNVEAFIWTIDLINADSHILPGVHLGTLIFDTCSSYQKIYRDVSNFLSNSLLLGDYKVQIPNSESLAGFVVDGSTTKVIDSVLDLTKPLNMSVLSTDAREIKYNDIRHYPQFLGFSLPNNYYIDAMIGLLKKYSWSYVSVLYENNNFITHRYVDAYSYFQHKAQQNGLQIATKESFNENNIYNTIKNLKSFAKIGSKIVVVFLSPENLMKFLSFNFALKENNRLLPTDVIYLTIDSQSVFLEFAEQNMNAISLSQDEHIITEFEDHFYDLSAQKNLKNPWFIQFWEKTYNCKGFNCNKIQTSLKQKNITINPKTTNIIHSVVAVAHGLEFLRQKLCPGVFNGLCPEFHQQLRQNSQAIYSFIKQNGFISLDGSPFRFNQNSNYLVGHLNIFNLQRHSNVQIWNDIGRFDYENGLVMSKSKIKFNNMNGTSMLFNKVISVCQDSTQCEAMKEMNVLNQTLPLVPVREAQATIALLIPLHDVEKSTDDKTCGHINPDVFEKFMALYYAVDNINQQQSSLPVPLNILILDICTLDEERLVRILSDYNFTPKVVSVLSLEENNNHISNKFRNQFLNLLGDYNPFVYNFHQTKNEKQNFFFNENSDLDKKNHQMLTSRSIIDLCAKVKWSTINLVYSNEFNKNYFIFEANKNNICVDKTIQVTMTDITNLNFPNEWNNFVQSMDSHIIVSLTNSDINEFIIKYSNKNLLERFIWIGDKNLKSASVNAQKSFRKSIEHEIILKRFSKETSLDQDITLALDNLSKYFNINNQKVNYKILNGWLHEYWQRKFHCSSYTQKHDPKCFDSKYARKALLNIKEIKRLIDFTKTMSNSIVKFIGQKCINGTKEQLDELCLYNFHLRNELKNNIIEDLSNNNYYLNDFKQVSSDGHYEVEVITNFGKTINIFNSLNWINVSDLISNRSSKIQTLCRTSCSLCAMQLSQSKNKSINLLFSDTLQSSLISDNSLYRNWYIALSILSTLGIIMVLICVLYFILIFPVALGTTIIGYQILIGLFLCFLINFAYLLPTNHTICWIRQFGLPFAYCIILSGFFVKSYNYWCQILMKKSTKSVKYNTPFAQISISLVFLVMQLILTLITMYNLNGSTFNYDPLTPKCTFIDHNKFLLSQPQFILPLALLIILFGFIMFFTIKTFSNQESRWIFVCSFLTSLYWISWLATITMHLNEKFILTIVANLITAFTIIVLLYIRKLYLFSKISRKILKERRMNMEVTLQGEPFADNQQQYGAFKTCTDHISWSNVHNRINFRNATRSPFEGDNEDNISSCGSVKSTASSQVQCQELYPMEVYDNQATSPANNPKINQSTRSIYDLIDDENMK